MLINTDFHKRTAVHANPINWIASPMKGVDRHMLDRIGAESGHATSIVRYAPGSSFSPHTHDGGEEFLVLEGVFQDEHGNYPAGTYVRNPPTSSHTPRSDAGCTIFVKLWQFDAADRTQIVMDTNREKFTCNPKNTAVKILPLFHDSRETVQLEQWQAGTTISLSGPDGLEILVLEGQFMQGDENFVKHAWLRLPPHYHARVMTGDDNVLVWAKYGNQAKTPSAK